MLARQLMLEAKAKVNHSPSQNIAAMLLTDRVLRLVNASDQHRHPYYYGENKQKDAAHEFKGSEDSADLSPGLHNKTLSFSLGLGSKSFASYKSPLFTN